VEEAKQNNKDIINRYDITSDSYDELYGEEQIEKFNEVFKNIEPKGKIADIGCGTGLLLEYLINNDKFKNVYLYVCFDLSINMLKIANDRAIRHHCDKCFMIKGNAEYLPFKDKEFDYVFSFSTVNLLDNPDKSIEEMKRIGKNVIISFVKKLKLVKVKGYIIGETEKDFILRVI
jgi:ubiquinone/menaquinone biosynthesis C-methylase UbiE